MDLGLAGRKALVCASSQGLGLACALSLAREGAWVTVRQAVAGANVSVVVADMTTPEGRAALVAAVPEADILVNNNAGPPPGALEDWDHEALLGAVEANLIPAVLLMRSFIPGMRARRFGRIVNITSAMVKSPRYPMGLSTAARAGLTAISKAISAEVAVDNVTINNLLPERIDTPRQEFMAQQMMKQQGIGRDEARRRIAESIAAKRFGKPEEFGDTCAFLCSVQAGFISGQNVQLDGGSYAGLV
jgi:3-oxoacyl-[acyl-carrier protein] reductase